jgi:nicotine blue oxidoreductase
VKSARGGRDAEGLGDLRAHQGEVRSAAIVLAAGEATRFGAPKQRLLLPSVLERLRRTRVDEILVVEGAHELEIPSDKLSQGISIRRVGCAEWARGPGASLRCGLAALEDSVGVAVVVLADGPWLAPEAVDRVLDAWRSDGGIVAASYGGSRGHPLALGRTDWDGIPDEGLRDRPVRLVPCDDLGAPGDVDTPDDLRAIQAD